MTKATWVKENIQFGAHGCRGFESTTVEQKYSGRVAESSHVDLQVKSREKRHWEWHKSFKTAKLSSRDTSLLTRPHLVILYKKVQHLGNKYSNSHSIESLTLISHSCADAFEFHEATFINWWQYSSRATEVLFRTPLPMPKAWSAFATI